MKRLILFVILITTFCFEGFAQPAKVYIGEKSKGVQAISSLYVDSSFYLGKMDTTFTPLDSGAVVFRPANKTFYGWDGEWWIPLIAPDNVVESPLFVKPKSAPNLPDTLTSSAIDSLMKGSDSVTILGRKSGVWVPQYIGNSGSGGSTVTTVTASAPLASSGGTAPNITADTSAGANKLATQSFVDRRTDSAKSNLRTEIATKINASQINYITLQKPVLPYNWYSDTQWTSLTSNDYVAFISGSVSGGKVTFTSGGASSTDYNHFYYKNKSLITQYYTLTDSFTIANATSSTTRGLGVGSGYSTNFILGEVDLSTGVNAGKVTVTTQTAVGPVQTRVTSVGAITFTVGDTIITTVKRVVDSMYFTVKNANNGSTQSVGYNTSPLFDYTTNMPAFQFWKSQPIIYNKGTGQYKLLRSTVTYDDTLNRAFAFIGDSKIQGFYNGSTDSTIVRRIQVAGYDVSNYGVSGAEILSFLATQYNENILAMKPKVAIISLGSNDIRNGRTWADIMLNYRTFTSILNKSGIKTYHMVIFEVTPSVVSGLASLDSFLKIEYPADYISSVYTATRTLGMNGHVADSIHQNARGTDTVAQVLLRSGIFTQPIYSPNTYAGYEGIKYKAVKDSAGIISKDGDNTGTINIGTTTYDNINFKLNGRTSVRLNRSVDEPQMTMLDYAGAEIGRVKFDSLGNTMVGFAAGDGYRTTTQRNTMVGYRAGHSALTGAGNYNTFIGDFTGAGAATKVNGCIFIGTLAGYYETGNYKFQIGNFQSGNHGFLIGDLITQQLLLGPTNNGTSPMTLTASAAFEVRNTTRGFLMPRVTGVQMNAISSPATGLQVYNTDSSAFCYYNGAAWIKMASGGSSGGTVTSVGFTGGLISVATATTTPAFTVAGTSGGIPYFSSSSTWASSGALASNALLIGGGAGAAPSSTTTGTGVLTALGVNTGSSGAFVVNGDALGTPSSGTLTNATGLPIAGITGLGSGVATLLAGTSSGGTGIAGTSNTTLTGTTTTATLIASSSFRSPVIVGSTTASGTLALRSTSGTGTTDAILFQVGTNGGTEAARITTGGLFGIGLTPTTDKLEVAGNISLTTAGNKLKITEGSNGSVGQTALVAGTKAITITGVGTSTRAIVTFVSVGGTVTTTWQYKAVCISNTLTITAIDNTGATNTLDTSTLNYLIIN